MRVSYGQLDKWNRGTTLGFEDERPSPAISLQCPLLAFHCHIKPNIVFCPWYVLLDIGVWYRDEMNVIHLGSITNAWCTKISNIRFAIYRISWKTCYCLIYWFILLSAVNLSYKWNPLAFIRETHQIIAMVPRRLMSLFIHISVTKWINVLARLKWCEKYPKHLSVKV